MGRLSVGLEMKGAFISLSVLRFVRMHHEKKSPSPGNSLAEKHMTFSGVFLRQFRGCSANVAEIEYNKIGLCTCLL
jgi:hypothetical protein